MGTQDPLEPIQWDYEVDKEDWAEGKKKLRAWLDLSDWNRSGVARPVLMKDGEPLVLALRDGMEDSY